MAKELNVWSPRVRVGSFVHRKGDIAVCVGAARGKSGCQFVLLAGRDGNGRNRGAVYVRRDRKKAQVYRSSPPSCKQSCRLKDMLLMLARQ